MKNAEIFTEPNGSSRMVWLAPLFALSFPAFRITSGFPSIPLRLNHGGLSMPKDLNRCFDAREWAKEFCRINSEFKARHGFDRPLDASDMEAWFASALLAGHWQGTQDANGIWLKRERTE